MVGFFSASSSFKPNEGENNVAGRSRVAAVQEQQQQDGRSRLVVELSEDDNAHFSEKPEQLGHEVTMETVPINNHKDGDNDALSLGYCSSNDSTLEDDIVHFHPHPHSSDDLKPSSWISSLKTVVSAALLLFCITLLMSSMWTQQTRATSSDYQWPAAAACALFWLVLLWLAIIEGGLNCQVGLRPLPTQLYRDTHPLAFQATQLCARRANNLERFIVGRQYMDLTMVFTISFLATAVKDVSVLGLPQAVCTAFLNSGLAMTLVTIVLGQLALQINAANCMLDYMNNYAMLGSTYLALAVEASGICHVVYLVQRIAASMRRNRRHNHNKQQENIETEEEAVSGLESGTAAITTKTTATNAAAEGNTSNQTPLWQSFLFWFRVVLSASLLCFALATVLTATFRGQTKMFEGVPPAVSVVLLVLLIMLVGLMDALQIALMAVVHIPHNQLAHRPTALRNARYVIAERRLQSFLLGRQIGQTVVQFLLARITTLNVPLGVGENIWGVSDTVQKLFNMGILGAIIATVLASLIWRVLASEFPLAFLSLPVSRPVIALCLWAEQTGVINIAWALAALHRRVTGIRPDECYLGDTDYYRQHHHHAYPHNNQGTATASVDKWKINQDNVDVENQQLKEEVMDPTLSCHEEDDENLSDDAPVVAVIIDTSLAPSSAPMSSQALSSSVDD
jgi:hypothetical protein